VGERKGKRDLILDTRPFQEVVHEIFIKRSVYAVKELAFFLGEDESATYKLLEGVRPIRVDWARRIAQFISMKNPNDAKLPNWYAGAAGFIAVPNIAGRNGDKIQAIMTDIAALVKGTK
jgi:hypothetical protein